jgi:hypothetical protein
MVGMVYIFSFSGETFFQRSVTEWLEWLSDSLFLEKIVPRICYRMVGMVYIFSFSGETFFQRSVTEWLEWLGDSFFWRNFFSAICYRMVGMVERFSFSRENCSKDLLQKGRWILFF